MESRILHTAMSSETLVSETEQHDTKRDDSIAAPPTAQKGWKPRSMTAPVLIPIALLALLIAATIEFLAQRSRLNGGLALAPTQDDIPQYAMLCYLYLPTVIAVIFSLIWHWVDLDVKRMQPWFELSKADGATAENSLFLDYPYDFVGIVPFKSAKRRHWPVFLSSTVVVAIFWLVTPLQSSILGTGVVTREGTVTLSTRSRLASLEEQKTLISPQILTMGYSIGWLGQAFPPFTSATYATLPFYVENDPGHSRPKTNWTATTTKLTTELECWPALMTRIQPASQRTDFGMANGQDCNATVFFNRWSTLNMLYIGYFSDPYSDWALQDSGRCPPTGNATHQFLAIWSKTISPGINASEFDVTALYCQPHYYKQQVSISVAADDLKPDDTSIVALSPREPLSENEFNSTTFEYMLANGLPLPIETRDMPFNYVIEQHPRLDKTGVDKPVSNMVGYALAGHNEPADRYRDPILLQEAFNRAHQYLFSSAVYNLLVNETDFPNRTATSTYALSGIIVSRKIAAAVETLLVMAAVCILGLLWSCHKSTSNLHFNPSSISRHVEIFRNSRDVDRLFYTVDCADDKSLLRLFPHDRFRLLCKNDVGTRELFIERISCRASQEADRLLKSQPGYYKPFRPLALRRISGFSFILIQASAIAVIAYLKAQEIRNKGLMRPSNNFEVQQLLENFIPTIFATLTEPFLVLLNRFLCVLQPFKALSMGRSVASESLDITYSSIPPQLVLWKAIMSRHILLALICIVALLSNVLAVGLSALFKGSPTTVTYAREFRPIIAPEFNGTAVATFYGYLGSRLITSSTYQDHMYLAKANITLGTALPPWTSSEYFFQPHIVSNSVEGNSSYQFVVSTRGFGVDANCSPVAPSPIPVNVSSVPSATANNLTCDGAVDLGRAAMRKSDVSLPNGPSAIEYSESANYPGNDNCSKDMVFGWGRKLLGQDVKASITASFAMCRPIFRTALFDVTHDALGNIISYHRTSNITNTLDYAEFENHMFSLLTYANGFLQFGQETAWHNDTLSRKWMNYLVAASLGTRDHLDASKPTPDPRQLVGTIDSVYRLLFVLLLSLNQHLFLPNGSNTVVVGSEMREETRVFMAQPAYIISVTILGLNVIAAVAFYWRANVSTLPRMPTSIGSMLAYVASSRMVQEDQKPQKDGDRTYSFGRFIGVDKEAHLGIDCDPHVALISPDSLKEKRALLWSLGYRGEKRKSVRDGTWI